jgi:hypothetical protein
MKPSSCFQHKSIFVVLASIGIASFAQANDEVRTNPKAEKSLVTVKKTQSSDGEGIGFSISVNDKELQTTINHALSRGLDGLQQALSQIDGKKIEIAASQLNDLVASVDVNEIRETVRRAMEDANVSASWSYSSRGDSVTRGNPYSSRETREFKQVLSDGTVISRQSTRLLARDGEGRTRQELRQPDGASRIFINDPVAKRTHIIDPQKRTACSARFDKDAINDCFKQMRGDWKPLGFSFSPTDRGIPLMVANDDVRVNVSSNAKVIDLTEGQSASGRSGGFSWSSSDGGRVEVTPGASSVTTPPNPPTPPKPPLPGQTTRDSKVVRENSTTTYEGLKVDVSRSVETIAVGVLGNNRPIESVFERYYSPDLKMTVYSKRSDPRSGESIYRMTEIKRSEPDANLFRVPAGFSEVEGKSK